MQIPATPRKSSLLAGRDRQIRKDHAPYVGLGLPPIAGVTTRRDTPEEAADRAAYTAQVLAYNARLAAAQAAKQVRQQARINAAEVAKVRSAACPVCFSTHAGEC
jgi:hypothetical protein